MTNVILINGPPRSGKDTLGVALQNELVDRRTTARVFRFATEVKNRTHGLFGMPGAVADAFEDGKDEPREEFNGMTPRQAYIWVSEEVIKPKFGKDIFGRWLADEIARYDALDVAIVTDSGFLLEAGAVEQRFPDIGVIQISGRGTFEGDSRGSVEVPGRPMAIINNVDDADRLLARVPVLADAAVNFSHGVWIWH